jgi:hypothetical protein
MQVFDELTYFSCNYAGNIPLWLVVDMHMDMAHRPICPFTWSCSWLTPPSSEHHYDHNQQIILAATSDASYSGVSDKQCTFWKYKHRGTKKAFKRIILPSVLDRRRDRCLPLLGVATAAFRALGPFRTFVRQSEEILNARFAEAFTANYSKSQYRR